MTTAAADDPLVRSIVSRESGDELLPLVTTQGQPVLEHATERLAAFLDEAWPRIAREQARLLAECVVRLAISCVTLPGGPSGMGADAVATVLRPYVERAVA